MALFGASIWAAGGIAVLRRKAPLFASISPGSESVGLARERRRTPRPSDHRYWGFYYKSGLFSGSAFSFSPLPFAVITILTWIYSLNQAS